MKKLLIFGMAAAIALGACKKKDEEDDKNTTPTETKDTEKPKTTISAPTANTEFELGKAFDVKTTNTDNKELIKLYVSLKDPSGNEAKKEEVDLSGTSIEKTVTFTLDTSVVAGDYTISAYASDKTGNKGDAAAVTVKMKKPAPVAPSDNVKPLLNSFNIQEAKVYSSLPTNELEIWGNATDETELDRIEVIFYGGSTELKKQIINCPGVKTKDFGTSTSHYKVTITGIDCTSSYSLKVVVYDKAGNNAEQTKAISCS